MILCNSKIENFTEKLSTNYMMSYQLISETSYLLSLFTSKFAVDLLVLETFLKLATYLHYFNRK